MDIAEIGRQFGLDEAQTRAAFEQLAPVVAAGIRRNNQSDDGLAGLLKALQAGGHSQYADDPSALQYDQVAGDGNAILGHVFGSKDVSRGVASQAADLSGISSTVLKKMLPVVAAIIMGQLAKGMFGGGKTASANQPAPAPGGSGGGLGDILGEILGGGAGQGQAAPRGGSTGGQGGGLGDILGDILGGRAGQGQAAPRGGQGGGGLGDILGDILGGGARGGGGQGQAAPRGSQGGGGLGDILGDILGGGAQGGQPGNAPRPQAGGQAGPGGVSLEDLLREMMGGGKGGSDAGGYNQDVTQRSRKRLDDVLGGGTSSGSAADDLLNSVDRMTKRR
ncbi:MAG TPA: DUF937 domain-containing protein [Nordella sp.]|nr:DUF937 domain-containing protein [Nordella sp.]